MILSSNYISKVTTSSKVILVSPVMEILLICKAPLVEIPAAFRGSTMNLVVEEGFDGVVLASFSDSFVGGAVVCVVGSVAIENFHKENESINTCIISHTIAQVLQ